MAELHHLLEVSRVGFSLSKFALSQSDLVAIAWSISASVVVHSRNGEVGVG